VGEETSDSRTVTGTPESGNFGVQSREPTTAILVIA